VWESTRKTRDRGDKLRHREGKTFNFLALGKHWGNLYWDI
jgi:hypothetical protein